MPPPTVSAQPWLNPRRLRAQGLCLALCLWGIYAWILATPSSRDRNGLIKGTDFLHFYTLGTLARMHDGADLYDMRAQTKILGGRVPAAAQTVYLPLYGPQVSLLFAPFAALPYGAALAAWWVFSAGVYAICLYVVWKSCPDLQPYAGTVLVLGVANPAFFHLIAWGQTSALALAGFTAVYWFLRKGRVFAAGLALGCLIFKPQLGLVVAFVFCAAGAWRIVAGASCAASTQLAVGWIYYGTATMREYFWQLVHVRRVLPLLEPRIEQTHCLRTFWQMLVPLPVAPRWLYVISALLVLGITFVCWRSFLPLSLRYSAILLATVLVSPHLTVYDLVILSPALMLVADWIVANRSRDWQHLALTAYLVYLLPLLGLLALWIHIQLSVLAIFALLWMIWKMGTVERQSVELAI